MPQLRVASSLLLCSVLWAGAAPQEPPSGTVLVANMDDDSVWLVDVATGERRGRIATHIAPHEIAVTSDGTRAAVTNYGDERGPGNQVQLFDVRTGEVTGEFAVEGYERLHGAAWIDRDTRLALTSERTGEILVVDPATGAVERALPTGGRASHMLALAAPWVWTANIADGTVSRLSLGGGAPPTTWPAGTRTEGIAATPDGAEGWTGSMQGGEVVGVDGASGRIVHRVEGLGVPYRLAITADGSTVVVSDPERHVLGLIDRASGALTQVDVGAAAREAGLDGAPSPQGFVLSPDGRWAFVSTKNVDRVAVVDLRAGRVVRFLQAGDGPDGIAFSPVRSGVGPE
ncbi:MAG: YncE family protein [Gemmatimonadota bacterium]